MPTSIRQQQLPQLPVTAQRPPNSEQGPRIIPVTLNFPAANTIYSDDLQVENMLGAETNVQAAWIDNPNAGVFTFIIPSTNFTLRIPPQWQGFYQLLCADGFAFQYSHATINAVVNMSFMNFPVSFGNWKNQ